MRILRRIFALAIAALSLPISRAQDAVLVLSPSPVTSVRAGTGTKGFRGDGSAAVLAQLAAPAAMAEDAQGNLYVADTRNHRIRLITSKGIITTVAGTGDQGWAGDGGPASQAQLDTPCGIALAADGILYIADTRNHRIRRVDSAGTIRTVAGTGTAGFSGDGASATNAQLSSPAGLAVGLAGDLYIADAGNHRIRHVSADGTIATVAGDGAQGNSPDGAQATAAHLDRPAAVAVRPDGAVLIADTGNNRVLFLQTDGTLHLLNTATMVLRRPSAISSNSSGDTLIADTGNFRVAQVSSSGAGLALGSGLQGALNLNASPTQTPFGSAVSVIDSSVAGAAGQFSALDRDSSQVIQVALPQITFADTIVATTSTSRSLQFRNAGTQTLTVSSISLPATVAPALSTSCAALPFQLAPGQSCNLDLAFTPQTEGSFSGLLEVKVQSAPPQRVLLAGTGLRTGSQLTSTTSLQASGSLIYAGTPLTLTAAILGSSATAATGTVTFLDGTTELGSGTLNPSAQASLTTSVLPTGSHTLRARYNGDAHFQGSTSEPAAITVATPPDFTLAATSGTRVSLQSGSAGTLTFTVQPVGGVLNRTVSIAVDGLPSGAAINVTPVPVLLASDPVAVSVAFKLPVSVASQQRHGPLLSCLALAAVVLLRRRRIHALLIVTLTVLPLLLQGCGGGYLSGTSVTAQSAGSTYAVTVTAACSGVTGATLTHSTTFTVVVQP